MFRRRSASALRVHGVLLASQLILVVHAFVVKRALEAALSRSPSLLPLAVVDAETPRPPPWYAPALAFAALRSAIAAPLLLLVFLVSRRLPSSSAPSSSSTSSTEAPFPAAPPLLPAAAPASSASTPWAPLAGAALCGFFGVFLYPLLYILGMQGTTPVAACVCEALTPVFSLLLEMLEPLCCRILQTYRRHTAVAAHYDHHGHRRRRRHCRRRSVRRAAAVMLAVAGSIVMTVHSAFADDLTVGAVTGRFVGNLLVTGSALSYAIFLAVQRKTIVALGTSVMYTTAWGNCFGAALLVATATATGSLDRSLLALFGTGFWYGMVWAALVTSVVGYSLEGLANAWSSPTLVAVYNAVQPFGAGVLSHGVVGGRFAASAVELVSAAAVAGGVVLLRTDDAGGPHSDSDYQKMKTKKKKTRRRTVRV